MTKRYHLMNTIDWPDCAEKLLALADTSVTARPFKLVNTGLCILEVEPAAPGASWGIKARSTPLVDDFPEMVDEDDLNADEVSIIKKWAESVKDARVGAAYVAAAKLRDSKKDKKAVIAKRKKAK